MDKLDNPVIDDEEIAESKKNKIIMLSIIIIGTVFLVMLKEIAFMLLMISIPLTIIIFIISFLVIIIKDSKPIESFDYDTLKDLGGDISEANMYKENVNVVTKKGCKSLKTLGIIFLSYVILCGIAYIMSMTMTLFVDF